MRATTDVESLKLLISVEQPTITAPFPARVTLHLHNGGPAPLWLYRRARSQTSEGSMLEVRLEPVGTGRPEEIATAAHGTVFESIGLPRPKLVKLAADEDYTEKTTLKLSPARAGTNKESPPVWGRYRLTAVYRAEYSTGEEIARNLGVVLWQGEVTSNTIEIEIRPPAGDGSIAGKALDAEGHTLEGVLASLSDSEERLVDQVLTDPEGRFFFTHLPLGVYWVTVRRRNYSEDTTVFHHLQLTRDEPAGTIEFVLLRPEVYEPQQLLHKPVLLRVTDSSGRPLEKVMLEVVWSTGTVLDNVKGETNADGTVALELIPGRNFVTVKRRGCPKQEDRVDVQRGEGVDGFKLTLQCEK